MGDDWVSVPRLATRYKDYIKALGDGSTELNAVQASDFLQKEGATRTGSERKLELVDIDLDCNNMLALIELLLLIHKKMILLAYYKRVGGSPKVDLEENAIGVTGVGSELLEELFTLPVGLDPALEKAIADFMARKKAREDLMNDLEVKSKSGGVKALTAGNELAQLKAQDTTWMNKEELTLNAARKKASKNSGDEALRAKKEAEESQKAAAREASRNKLKSMASKFEN